MFPADLAKALLAGGMSAAVIAIATYATGIDVPVLALWNVNTTAAVRLLVTVVAGTATFYLLKGQRRTRSCTVAVLAVVACAGAWYVYDVETANPISGSSVLTWNGSLYTLYVLGFALCAASLSAAARIAQPRA
jgi:hypothetical protein